jgi:hypothetical protein
MSSPSFNKREKEKQRQDQQRAKEVKRQQRRTERATAGPREVDGIDPDIAGIVAGPQPIDVK